MTFKEAILDTEVYTTTTNGMVALESSLDANVDLFYQIGASRGKDITKLFEKAYLEDVETALLVIQWARDIRGGAGERQLFRQCLLFLEEHYVDDFFKTNLLRNIPEIGRWDDLLIFKTTSVKLAAFRIIAEALEAGNGLCSKWMPRRGRVAEELRQYLTLSPKSYRKLLVNGTKVVENKMCKKEWNDINFSHVPSLAMSRYTKAFGRNAPENFGAYKEALKKGDPSVKVNAGAVYPYDITKTVMYGDSELADEQWKALPNYIGDASVLPLVDVSGSMGSLAGGMASLTCMEIAISLGLYCSEKNTGPFKDLFLTFSEHPEFVHLRGNLSARYRQMKTSSWGYNTNVAAAFDRILEVAQKKNVAQEDMPDVLLILSDMQFDQADQGHTAYDVVKVKYEQAGYKAPVIVFWNLNSHDNVPVRFDQYGTALVSGFSPAIMKAVLGSDFDSMTPKAIMLKTISDKRYALYGKTEK